MITRHTTMSATKDALIIRIPWKELVGELRPSLKKLRTKLTPETVLRLVEEGRQAHAKGKTRLIHSLGDVA